MIGAGIAGLSAGSYLERNGYETQIFEAHYIPGGLCTAWKRGDYTFDYCIHWLMGTKKGTGDDIIWDELGALTDENGNPTQIINFDEFIRMEVDGGDVVRFYANADKLKKEFLRVAPEDEKMIHKFIKDIKKMANIKIAVATEDWGLKDRINYVKENAIPFLKIMKYGRMTLDKFASKWKSPKLREAFTCLNTPSWSAASLIMGLAMQHSQAAGYPVGGSLTFARNIERVYLDQGGKINYSSKVEKILVKEDEAVGIRLENGEEIYGDEIVSAADGYSTLYKMLDGKYLSPKLEKAYESFSLFPSSIFLGFGVKKDLSDFPHGTIIKLTEPLELPDGSMIEHFNVDIYNFDLKLAPEGKTPVTAIINTWKGNYWLELAKKDPDKYNEIKEQITKKVIKALDERIPGFTSAVEEIDTSTPNTVYRYTSNWQGSYEGFAPTPSAMTTRLPKEVPGLKNCHMIGQWTQPGGGIPPAAVDGRNLARKLCKRDKKLFIQDKMPLK